MKLLIVQLQPVQAPAMNLEVTLAGLQKLAPATVNRVDDGPYINVEYETDDVETLWPVLQKRIQASRSLSRCAIVTCEGDFGCDDHHLLYHFDHSQPLSEVS